MANENIKQFSVADPRTFDGNPYEVAERACAQAEALLAIAADAIEGAFLMARNAEMERQIVAGQDPNALAFENGPYGKRLDRAKIDVANAVTSLRVVGRAAGFDPKAPLNRG